MKKLQATLSLMGLSFATTAVTFAAAGDQAGKNLRGILTEFGTVVDLAIGILVTLALATFFWGLVRYIFKLGGKEGGEQGKHIMIWGITALFVMVSVWGIIGFIQNFFDVRGSGSANGGYSTGELNIRRVAPNNQ